MMSLTDECLKTEYRSAADQVRSLVPLLREHSAQAERDRKLSPIVVDSLRAAGLLRMSVPRSHGGDQLTLREQTPVIFDVGRGCASAGWLVGIAGVVDALISMFPQSCVDDLFHATPDVFVCQNGGHHDATVTAVEGGYRVTGGFRTVSGCEIGDWMLMAVVPVVVDGVPNGELVSLLAPLDQARIEHTWDVAGMRATGSHTVRYDACYVPRRHSVQHTFIGQQELVNLPQPEKYIGLAHRTLAPLIGAAYGAFDVVQDMLAHGKPLTDSVYGSALESPLVRHWLAEADHLLDTSWTHLMLAADLIDTADAAGTMSREDRTRARRHMTTAIDRSREALALLLDLGGTGGFSSNNALQRYWRDFEIATHHAIYNKLVCVEDYTRCLLQIEPSVSLVH